MRTTTTQTQQAWLSGDYTGANKAMMRATIQNLHVNLQWIGVGPKEHAQHYATMIFGQRLPVLELPNLKSVHYDKATDADAQTMKMVLYNTEPMPLGATPDANDDWLGQPGYYTYNRGTKSWSLSKWGHVTNGWQKRIVPDRIIRLYEGFGFDTSVGPDLDPHMYQTGLWRIDDIETDNKGLITITARDMGGVLIDEVFFPPVVPFRRYPLKFSTYVNVQNPDIVEVSGSSSWKHPVYSTDSGVPYNGPNGSIYGHRPTDAFDTSASSYWLSIGNADPNADYAYEYVEGKFKATTLAAVKFHVWGGPYRVYISVMVGGKWQGRSTVPYNVDDPISAPNGADVPFVHAMTVAADDTVSYKFPTAYANASHIRLTFHHLYNSGIGPYPYRAGVRDVQVAVGTQVTTTVDGGTHREGNYGDYSDVIKLIAAYGGFWWPAWLTNAVTVRTNGTLKTWPLPATVGYAAGQSDTFLVSGRIWGDIRPTHTAGVTDLGVDIWDKKSLMDGVNYVKDIIGFLFFINDFGGVVWRLPNIYNVGNWITTDGSSYARTTDVVVIDETQTLIGLTVKLSSLSIREKTFIASTDGRHGAVVNAHFNDTDGPFYSGLRRIGGWCVDTETEVFTRRGWLRHDQVEAGDLTLSLNEDGKAVWQPIREVAVFDAALRDMVVIEANNFDALTTPDHRWLTQTYSTQEKRWNWEYRTTDRLSRMSRVPRARPGAAANPMTISDSMVELVAWAYTEGCIKRGRFGRDCGMVIYQSPTANPEGCEAIRLALKTEFGEQGWTSRLRKGCLEFSLSAAAARAVLSHLTPDKAPTMDFLTILTQRQLELFIDVSILGDGSTRKTTVNSKKASRFFYQNVGPRLDAFLAACALAGVATSVHVRSGEGNWHGKGDVATVVLLQNNDACIGQAAQRSVQHDGVVWCPAMPKYHNWLARRGGSVYYTGNTDQHFETTAECITMADLITLQQLFTYRTDTITVVGNPAINIDDQVHLTERVTEENELHYVNGITCDWDIEKNVYQYTLATHWLGEEPFGKWVFDPHNLSPDTQTYLRTMGAY